MEFHISRLSRDRYQFDDALFALTGNVILADFQAVRALAQKMNEKRDLARFPEQAVRAGPLNAMGLVDEILHATAAQYREQRNPQAMGKALAWLEDRLGRPAVDQTLRAFADQFPAVRVYRQGQPVDAYLAGQTDGAPNREVVLEEMLLLWLANLNPAFSPFRELFDDARLAQGTVYPRLMPELRLFFDTQPGFGPDNQNLVDLLRAPALAHPHSLTAQLEYIASRWGGIAGRRLYRLLSSLDLIKEEERPAFQGPGPAQAPVYDLATLAQMGLGMPGPDVERYSPDRDWMPRLVLMAKNTHVWLDQLSRKHRRDIRRLDHIPDEELDELARWGFTGLWLIGLWERSQASQRIKQLCGNPDALPSAYSLYEYRIAADLGGEPACDNLRERALRRGIRLASDMVPNHMGIDSPWVVEHPDWFISLPHSPYPSYTFDGPDLSRDGRVGVHLEDHYYNRTDAAVVFKRVDRVHGGESYVYHGNDGTNMPWNDTAQLNYLKPEVREAVIQTILHVARQFPIIRFDAAMTLAKRHFQRLWFPEPGTGGAVPSRAGQGLTRQQIDQAMPEEFWREVVDRAAREAPDTLLLAEAFWLMEGYFVRTLGMHRVYNSAFMNMLRDEDNAKYRGLIKSTLEFDPQILKRYVSFMNNPDERTAVDQFGKGDKYFGVCALLATLPGLPMFGHGQVEGYSEKYGMEFRRAMWDEQPDGHLIERHEREIFPLLHRRALFADVEHFVLYDFFTPDGSVDENVFAYSNQHAGERALMVYHNRFAATRGWIRTSVAALMPGPDGARALRQTTLGDSLELSGDDDAFLIFRDQVSGLEYLRRCRDLREKGLYVELDAYKRHLFLDFRQARDDAQRRYARLEEALDGRGVPSVAEALQELLLQSILQPFRELMNVDLLSRLIAAQAAAQDAAQGAAQDAAQAVESAEKPAAGLAALPADEPTAEPDAAALADEVERKMLDLLRAVRQFARGAADEAPIAREARRGLELLLEPIPALPPDSPAAPALDYLREQAPAELAAPAAGFAWLFVRGLGRVAGEDGHAERSRAWIDEWKLGRTMSDALRELGLNDSGAASAVALVKILAAWQGWHRLPLDAAAGPAFRQVLETALRDADVRAYLGINRYRDILWFNKEAFERLVWWLMRAACVGLDGATGAEDQARLASAYRVAQALLRAEQQSEYQVEKLLAAAL